MTKKCKLIFGSIFATGLILSPIVLISSCGKNFYSLNDMSGLQSWLNEIHKSSAIKEKAENIRKSNNDFAKSLLNQKTIQISTGGKVNDNSFNQSVWETISNFSIAIGNKENRYYETQAIDQNMQNDAYNYAISNGFKIWVLTGFQQEQLFKTWISLGKNKERFNNANIKIIAVDWYSDMSSLVEPGRILGLNFKTQESSFAIAYAAAKLLSEIYPGNENKENRYFNTFAGGDFSGATNFNYGFYEGLKRWNIEQGNDNSKKVLSTIVSSSTSVDLNTSFSITNDSRVKVNSAIDGYSEKREPKVIMPVAGSLSSIALDRIKDKKSNQWVIGVDTDMSLSFPTTKHLILTSSEKKISIAVYKALSAFYGLDGALENEKIHQINMKQTENKNYEIHDVNGRKTSINVIGGYAEGFVGVSKSTLNSNLKFNNGITYAKRFDQLIQETWDKFFGIDKISGLFETDLVPTKEQIQWGPAYFNNVKYGEMTVGNLNNYFNPVIFGQDAQNGKPKIIGINSWNKKEAN